jgi:hypothetical protein
MTKPKICTLDLETSPLLVFCWGLFKQFINLDQIVEDTSILSISYKWLGEDRVHHHNTGGLGPEHVRDDTLVVQMLWNVLDEADIVVMQNGKKFDQKRANARFIMAGMPPPSPYKVIDTLLEARSIAGFTSNKLAWLSAILTDQPKDKHKDFPGMELWLECLKDNAKAWKAMKAYNNIDVRATEGVYIALRPYMIGHPNVAAYNSSESTQCPKCGSEKMQSRGVALTQSGQYKRFRCGGCGGWARGRYTENSTEKRRSLLSN